MAQNKDCWWLLVNMVMNLIIPGKFLNYLSGCQLPEKDFALEFDCLVNWLDNSKVLYDLYCSRSLAVRIN
jgi:hypothetical protein